MTKIYLVRDYDTIVYAGTKLKDAKTKVKFAGAIDVWVDGKWVGWWKGDYKDRWTYKALR